MAKGTAVPWERDDPSLICVFGAPGRPDDARNPGRHVMLLLHAGATPRTFIIPPPLRAIAWRQFINTAAAPPADIHPQLDGPPPPVSGTLELESRSLVCFVAVG